VQVITLFDEQRKKDAIMKDVTLLQIAGLAVLGFGLPCSNMAQTNDLFIYRAAELEFPMNYGALYQLQETDNRQGAWSNSAPAILGEDCFESFLQSTRGGNQKFWRVVQGSPTDLMDFSRARSLSSTNGILFENVQWQGTNYQVRYRVGSSLHQTEMKPMTTFTIPGASITIDGSPSDWAGVRPVYADAQHDQSPPDGYPGTDIEGVRLARDSQNIYVAFFLYDGDPAADGTMYWCELTQYWQQLHTPGDTCFYALYTQHAGWAVAFSHREVGYGVKFFESGYVGVGTKFIEFKIPIVEIEYDGGGILPKRGIETRFLRTYVHHVHNNDVNNPLTTYDGAGEDNKVMVVNFY
jgi:hypothetical protein